MSSTDDPGNGVQQAAPPIAETPETPAPEVATPPGGSEAVTPEAGTPAAPAPADAALADPAAEPAPPAAHTPAPAPAPPAAPAETVVSDPSQWGRVDEQGTVFVRTPDGEREVGSWQAGDAEAGLAHYGRRYDDLATEVALLEARLKAHTGNPGEIKAKAEALASSIPTAAAVGDLEGLAARAHAMVATAESAAAEYRAEKAAARAAQVARKEALAAEAEQIAAESTSWKAAGDRLKAIVEEWKTIRGIDRKTDDALWQRFAAARDAFGRRRGAHFAQLDAQRGEARAAKQELIKEAQRLSTSTEWGPTSAAMRSLMDRWKAVPRTGRDGDDDLWKQFRAAQDVFFSARAEQDKARDAEQVANQQAKEELLAEAEQLDPGKDLRGAQNALRKIQERYDAIGHVPRAVMRQLEDRMMAVEQKVRGAADAGRVRTAPENPMVASMRAAVTKAEEQLAKAEAAGDERRIAEAQANLATRREWLAEAEKSARR
ncbi:DUF349 domain-containing protein [Blastococcus sp. MG754426]|uniref:DUF349 domain-containing protein n=1 Tax=unclassified Blastococcus TaxID=2619396 RepID=UPI001EF032FD|nr:MULTISPECIES: DUF349 domain-containing protein [unclassified Blastococcus]MCF6507494.1 DUF349 domain-containing protein [Blastococcus sp. MG754426]MCF6512863.1 DUF349 domain-containing protein [Blastococcus sp. MG754427]MCF6733606.1 DUF349 domain-containing protein [Blastococcus sp. KM273129]